MSKLINYNNEFHNKILDGIDKAEKCVCSTLGPSGRPVLLNDGRRTRLTKDGITVFSKIELDDPIENSAVMALREASAKVANEAGDGTTTVTALGAAIYRNGLKYTTLNANPIQIKNGIDMAAKKVVEIIKSKATPISTKEDIKKVCLISSNGDEKVSDVISEVFHKLGKDATIQIEDSGSEIGYTIVDGFQLQNSGYLSPFFCTSDDMTCSFSNAYVLIVDGKITNIDVLIPTLQAISKEGAQLLIVADSIESEVMSMLIMNRLKTGFQVCCIKAPSYGEYRKATYRDIAMLTGGKVISMDTGTSFDECVTELPDGSKVIPDNSALGVAKSIYVTKDTTTIVGCGDNKEEFDEYVKGLKAQIDSCSDDFEVKKMKERYARLTSGIGKISAFAQTELELNELKDRIEDAHCAARAAIMEGIVPGGGTSLLSAKKELSDWSSNGVFGEVSNDESIGIKILLDSLEAPIRRILENAGIDASYIVSKILESDEPNVGFNVVTKKLCDMVSSGIIDPCAVECSAVLNAASVAGLLLTSSSCIVTKPEKKNPVQ